VPCHDLNLTRKASRRPFNGHSRSGIHSSGRLVRTRCPMRSVVDFNQSSSSLRAASESRRSWRQALMRPLGLKMGTRSFASFATRDCHKRSELRSWGSMLTPASAWKFASGAGASDAPVSGDAPVRLVDSTSRVTRSTDRTASSAEDARQERVPSPQNGVQRLSLSRLSVGGTITMCPPAAASDGPSAKTAHCGGWQPTHQSVLSPLGSGGRKPRSAAGRASLASH
jgi:hypothetical protein